MNRRGFLAGIVASPLFVRVAQAKPVRTVWAPVKRAQERIADADERAVLSELLGVPVEQTTQYKYEWLEQGPTDPLPYCYYNYCQIIVTPTACARTYAECERQHGWEWHRDEALRRHIRTIEEVLDRSKRCIISEERMLTYTGGRRWWAHDYGASHSYKVMAHKGRCLRFIRLGISPDDIAGEWRSDVGYRPLRAS